MIYDIQKASIFKRVSALLLDLIVLAVLSTGFAYLSSFVLNVSSHQDKLQSYYDYYVENYDVNFGLTEADFEKMSEEELNHYKEVEKIIQQDTAFNDEKNTVVLLTLLTTFLGILLGFTVSEFVIPLIFKNGQTIGKKVFSIVVLKSNSVKMSNVQFFVRTYLGKFALETMIPVNIVTMLLLGIDMSGGAIVVIILSIVQVIMVLATKNRTAFHDMLSFTVVCDSSSQMIFESEEELIKYKEKIHAEAAAKAPY
ncbi:MAG: RDD family protein [Clostridia bacterium]|nr:RDD family protein [Clostridia bacterium]